MPDSITSTSRSIDGVTYALRFDYQGDRFAHRLIALSNDESQVLVSSVEGTSKDEWPASSPFQDIHQQEIDGRQVIMGVGMAGSGHWSAACSLNDQNSDSIVEFHFDFACRYSGESGWLGSQYSLSSQATKPSLRETGIDWVDTGLGVELIALELDGAVPIVGQNDSGYVQVSPFALERDPSAKSTSSPFQTIRWQYLLKIRKTKA